MNLCTQCHWTNVAGMNDTCAGCYARGLQKRLAERDAELAWVMRMSQTNGIEAVRNKATGYFISIPIYKHGELYDRKRIAWSPPDGSWSDAIKRAMSGEDPDAAILAHMKSLKKAARSDEQVAPDSERDVGVSDRGDVGDLRREKLLTGNWEETE